MRAHTHTHTASVGPSSLFTFWFSHFLSLLPLASFVAASVLHYPSVCLLLFFHCSVISLLLPPPSLSLPLALSEECVSKPRSFIQAPLRFDNLSALWLFLLSNRLSWSKRKLNSANTFNLQRRLNLIFFLFLLFYNVCFLQQSWVDRLQVCLFVTKGEVLFKWRQTEDATQTSSGIYSHIFFPTE